MYSVGDLIVCFGDLSGIVGIHIDEFNGVDGRYCVGQSNSEGRMLLEFCLKKELFVLNT